jgi:hypothetical protein
LQDFLRHNGPKENVSAALELFQKKDPRFVDLDRNYCLVLDCLELNELVCQKEQIFEKVRELLDLSPLQVQN